MKRLRAADRTPRPWKNGGGQTTDVAVFPDGAGLDDFDWRVSIARVDGDGPFSIFPGVDRPLDAVAVGAGEVAAMAGAGEGWWVGLHAAA
jgi:environmental stress-induced protein Ves